MNKFFPCIILVALSSLLYSQNTDIEKNIDRIANDWQMRLSETPQSVQTRYKYLFRENDKNILWSSSEIQDNSLILIQKVSYIKSAESGYLVLSENFTVSGDWYSKQNDYYSAEGKLLCVKWEMNTAKAEFPVTVDKRLYFNRDGSVYSQYSTVYRFNTQDIVSIRFQDVDVRYALNINDVESLIWSIR